jgi:hypothetical protein
MITNKIDLKLFSIDNDDYVGFTFRNIGERAVGRDKLTQKYLRYFYGNDCGAILNLYAGTNISVSTVGSIKNSIISAILKTNEKLRSLQSGKNLHADETFVDCELKKLDIIVETGQINIILELISQSGSVIVNI